MPAKSGTKEQTRAEVREPKQYCVIMHNDDFTTMDFVVMVLERIFGKSNEEATHIMLAVHNQGVGLAGLYTFEIAETKVAAVRSLARKNQFPLRCSLEKDS